QNRPGRAEGTGDLPAGVQPGALRDAGCGRRTVCERRADQLHRRATLAGVPRAGPDRNQALARESAAPGEMGAAGVAKENQTLRPADPPAIRVESSRRITGKMLNRMAFGSGPLLKHRTPF